MHFQVETLRRCFPPSIRHTLDELPKTLDETYERTLLGIDKEKRDYAYRIFQCLVVSIRPLRVEELAEIFAIQSNVESIRKLNPGWRPENPEEFVLSACSTLVAVVNVYGDRLVQFSHFSVREYLTSNRIADSEHVSRFHILRKPAHTLLARVCLSVLLQLDDSIDKAKIQNFPLALYASQHWADHAHFENVSSDIQDEMESLFDKGKPHFAAWISVYNIDNHLSGSTVHGKQPDAVPLYYAALCGFCHIAKHLVDKHPWDVNAQGGEHVTPLHAALDKGHVDIALLLLERGADVGSRGIQGVTPLSLASRYGYVGVVQTLIDRGADLNDGMEDWHDTPLFIASSNGRLEVARVLLEHGADVDHRNYMGWTPLHAASEYGYDHVARQLLDHLANPNAEGIDGDTPLHVASYKGKIMVVMLLLEHGANVDSQDWQGRSPLHYGSREGHLGVVRLLLDRGANVNARGSESRLTDSQERTPLHEASISGHLEVVRLLLDRGADVNAQGGGFQWSGGQRRTPLYHALRSKHQEVARLLLDRGADVNAPHGVHWTPLHLAADGGFLQIVQQLLRRGANPRARNRFGEMPYQVASRNLHRGVAQILWEHAGEAA